MTGLVSNGRVYVGEDHATRALERWSVAVDELAADKAMMIARSNELRDQLNARLVQRDRGQLGDDVQYGSQALAAGDLVICREINNSRGVVNGTRGHVVEASSWGVKIEVKQGEKRYLHEEYILKARERDDGRSLEHAYCLTAGARPGRRVAVGPAARAGPGSWPVARARQRRRHGALTPHRARLMRRPSPIARHTASQSTPAGPR